jgi:hypothetical protein
MNTLAVATSFAAALDAEDYEALAALVADECVYLTTSGQFVGPKAIVTSYKSAGTWAKANIESVSYESSVRITEDGGATVTFTDHLKHGQRSHTYSCEQDLNFDGIGKVCRISHRELFGQREAVDLYLESIGVKRASSPGKDAQPPS